MATSDFDSLLRRCLFFVCIACLYLQLSLGFPGSGFIIVGSLLALPNAISATKFFIPAIYLAAIALFSIIFTVAGGIFYSGQLFSLGLLVLTLFAATGMAITAVRFGRERLSAWFWWISVAILVLALLEIWGPLRPISDFVRTTIYPKDILYVNDNRDIVMHGFVRPKVFTSEPSHLGKFLTVFLLVSATASPRRGKHIVAGIVGYFIVASPVLLLTVAIPILLIARDFGFRRLLSSPLVIAALTLVGGSTLYLLYYIAYHRLGLFGGTVDVSAYLRVIRPLYLMREATLARPLFGYGLGAEESLVQINNEATIAGPYVKHVIQHYDELGVIYGSSIVTLILSFGWFGGLFWIAGLSTIRQTFGGDRLAFWVFWFGYGFFQGSLNTPLHLGPLFLIATASVAHMRRPSNDRGNGPRSRQEHRSGLGKNPAGIRVATNL